MLAGVYVTGRYSRYHVPPAVGKTVLAAAHHLEGTFHAAAGHTPIGSPELQALDGFVEHAIK